MMKFINKVRAYFGGYDKKEEHKMNLWKHEQIGYKIYSLEVAIKKLKEERNELMGA